VNSQGPGSGRGHDPTTVERVSGGIIGLVIGWILGSVLTIIPAVGALDPLPWLLGGAIGLLYGAGSPPRFTRMRGGLPEAVAGEPAPIGALAAVTIRDLERPTLLAMLIAGVVAIGSIPLGWAIYSVLGIRPSLTVLGILATLGLLAAMACMAFLPALLLDPTRRSALAAHTWLGAREFQRALGSRNAVRGFPTTAEAIGPWIASHPETDANREVHVELHLMRRDWAAARAAIGRLADTSPRDRFNREILDSMLRYQMNGDGDDRGARSAADAIPPGPEAVEARVALATLEARRMLPDGDWRRPLVEARRLIPEGDATILVRDHGAVGFGMLLRVGWPVLALVLIMTLILGPMVDGGPR
jgi:hypothetical protein